MPVARLALAADERGAVAAEDDLIAVDFLLLDHGACRPVIFCLLQFHVSLVPLVAHQLDPSTSSLRQAAWYERSLPPFVDALALVRQKR
jgi:hypothetical protein